DCTALVGGPLALQVQRLRIAQRVVGGVVDITGQDAGKARVLIRAKPDRYASDLRPAKHVLIERYAVERHAGLPALQLVGPKTDELARPVRLADEPVRADRAGLKLIEGWFQDVARERRKIRARSNQGAGQVEGP